MELGPDVIQKQVVLATKWAGVVRHSEASISQQLRRMGVDGRTMVSP